MLSSLQTCGTGLFCYRGTCTAAAERGGACDDQGGLPCVGDLGCIRVVVDAGASDLRMCGDRLAEGSKCAGSECQAGLTCSLDGAEAGNGIETCRRAPTPPIPQLVGAHCTACDQCESRACVGISCVRECTQPIERSESPRGAFREAIPASGYRTR